jgi:hypothetical protein
MFVSYTVILQLTNACVPTAAVSRRILCIEGTARYSNRLYVRTPASNKGRSKRATGRAVFGACLGVLFPQFCTLCTVSHVHSCRLRRRREK